MVENKPCFRAYWTLKQSTRPCSRKISVQGDIWNALSLINVVSKAISLWATGPFPKCERILAPCRLGKDVKVQRGISAQGMRMAVVSLLVADKAAYGSFDIFSPQWSTSSLFFFFFHQKNWKNPSSASHHWENCSVQDFINHILLHLWKLWPTLVQSGLWAYLLILISL